ncbi:hypothetical protein NLU13_9762 [Sarocladium strictum]|uniref:Zn(2)-C6 fungal-type domain-containing protein n=1 Tax=Sarocladium strictum TaxID=5046 RepID=A0AA39L461_SARSR|nr:hypothetical protein NLU13_9762 [Sarocladium strictum]
MRRQNHSCDYCRKSKKACDGFALNRFRFLSSSGGCSPSSSPASRPASHLLPCSYCVRTKKQCSFNANWGPSPAASVTERNEAQHNSTKRLKSDGDAQEGSMLDYDLELTLDDLSQAIRGHDSVCSSFPSASTPGVQSQGQVQQSDSRTDGVRYGHHYPDQTRICAGQDHGLGLESWTELVDSVSPWDTVDVASLNDHTASQASHVDFSSGDWYGDGISDGLSLSGTDPGSLTNLGKRKGRRASQLDDERSLSVYNTDFRISSAANNHLIIGNLLGIYHDVLENNLACWLAEENCPYKMHRPGRAYLVSHKSPSRRIPSASPQAERGSMEWGRDWSNRIYRRVTQLDRMAVRSRSIRLSRAQSHDASRALSLVIMAFATQWSQGRRRDDMQTRRPSQGKRDEEMEKDFERHLQKSVWRQAKRALDDVADVECFRVAYAEMVFGLMERPWDDEDELAEVVLGESDSDLGSEAMQSKVVDILAQDGPPVMLERAARKMQVLKFRFESENPDSLCSSASPRPCSGNMTDEDRETIGLLYWLAVMFDTVSAPMNERPVALGDEECQHDAAREGQTEGELGERPTDSRSSLRWNIHLFTRGGQDISAGDLSWPCSHDVAASAIARSAPIKILIFRHLSYLQNILRRKEFGQPIEDALWEATLVYRYWNTVYARFYRDLVQNYETVPTRIRAWFVCIYIPWHLACLMLADVVELVGQNKVGLSEHTRTRERADMVSRIRTQSAHELSELARVTAPGDGTEQLPDYHHAVNEGPLLTEPWTVLLVRAFAKSALFYLCREQKVVKVPEVPALHGTDCDQNIVRARYCIKALASLGKKSTMARQIANAFNRALGKQELDRGYT